MRVVLLLSFLLPLFCFALDIDQMRNRKAPVSTSEAKALKVASSKNTHTFYLGFSLYSQSILGTASQSESRKDIFSAPEYPLSLNYSYRFSDEIRILPEIDYTLFYKKGEDGGTEMNELLIHLPFVKKFNQSHLEWKAGLVFHQHKTIGSGGAITLNNGTSTANFAIPGYTRISNQFLSELGLIYEFDRTLVQINLLFESAFNNSKRNYSLLAGLTYNLGGF